MSDSKQLEDKVPRYKDTSYKYFTIIMITLMSILLSFEISEKINDKIDSHKAELVPCELIKL